MFQTKSPYTLMISGTGHAGMEAAIANLLEPGEKIIVGVNGIWGERVSDLAERYQGQPFGNPHSDFTSQQCMALV
jgi:alanine-glyoxylate transaminase/serine-glyoxylate transaminase/serine-pyruvate transaminase